MTTHLPRVEPEGWRYPDPFRDIDDFGKLEGRNDDPLVGRLDKLWDEGKIGPPQPPAQVALAWGSLAAVTVILVALIWWAFRAHRRRNRTGFFAGMLIGVGLSLLPLGLCYAIIGSESIRQ